MSRRIFPALVLTLVGLLSGCQEPDLPVPTAEEVESYYSISTHSTVEMSGNVAVLEVWQPGDQLQRGGPLWARVGPYFYIFTEATRDLLTDFPGLAAVRVITRSPEGDEVARATLPRDALNSVTWRRALNVTGQARVSGTERVGLIQDLVEYGEDHTTFEYNEAYTAGR